MRNGPINLIGGSNVDGAVAWLCEDTVNYVIEKAPSAGALTEYKLRDAPGLRPFVQGPTEGAVPAGPVRGAHDCEGKHFVVMGSTMYQITPGKVAIPLGTVPGTQRVKMANNQIVGGNQVIVTTGTPNSYVWNTYTSVFARITDPGYPGGGSVDYIDTYLVSVEPFGRYWFWSAQADATQYNTLDRAEAEADPDSIVGLAVNAFEVVIFGRDTVEFFYNAGGINGNQFKSKRVMNGHGCAARDSIVKLDNTLFWLGTDGILYRLNGYQAQPVSSPQFTQRIKGLNWAKAFAFAYEDEGHVMYCITFPDGPTFTFDVPVGAMTRRESYGLNRWRLNTLIKTGGKWIGGDFQSGLLYEVDWDYPMEGEGTPMIRERVSGNTFSDHNKIEVPLVELLFATGGRQIEPVLFEDQPDPPTITGAAPDGTASEAYAGYAYTLTGDAPLTVTLRSGSLPTGVALSSAGVLDTGVATAAGGFTFTLRVTDVHGLRAELTDTVVIAADVTLLVGEPDVIPASVTVIEFSPDDTYLAIAGAAAPYLTIYKRAGDVFTKLLTVTTPLTDRPQGIAWDPTSTYLAVAPENGIPPFVLKRTGDTFAWLLDLPSGPIGQERGLSWSPDGQQLVMVTDIWLAAWSVAGEAFTAVLPHTALAANSSDQAACQFSSDSAYLTVGLETTPFLAVYQRTGSTYTLASAPSPLPHAGTIEPRFSPNADYLAGTHASTPFFSVYKRDGASFDRLTTPAGSVGGGACEWHPSGLLMAVGSISSGTELWARLNDTFSLSNTIASPISVVTSIAFSNGGAYMAIGGGTVALYKVEGL